MLGMTFISQDEKDVFKSRLDEAIKLFIEDSHSSSSTRRTGMPLY